ncbi:MAG: ankyrin repeat domain-containing protein [Elusimicrobia bacterium]|nr:ankyrin repeat domain-containing protein [Elusimicrobiota bacterium]
MRSSAFLVLLAACLSFAACAPAIRRAASDGRTADVLKELDRGAKIDAPLDGWGETALGAAARNGRLDTMKALLDRGADPNASAGDAMHGAAYAGQIEALRLLLDRGGDINLPDDGPGATPVMDAASSGKLDALKFLAERGADLNARNKYNGTVIALAAYFGHAEMVRYLLSKGVDAEISWGQQGTPVEAAEKQGHPEIAAMIREELTRRKPAAPAAGLDAESVRRIVEQAVQAAKPGTPAVQAAAPERPSYRLAEDPANYAVVVGIEKYPDLPDARFAENDARAMREHLLALGFPSRNIALLTGTQASRAALVKNLEAWLARNVGEKSTVAFYYSGHGAPDLKTGDAYLVPADGDPAYLEETGYPLKRLYQKLNALPAARLIVMLDSCFSGTGERSVVPKGTRPLVPRVSLGGPGRITVLAASQADQASGAYEEGAHGLFTYFLLKGLDGAAGPAVTAGALHDYLTPKVRDEAKRANRDQTPQLQGDPGMRLR